MSESALRITILNKTLDTLLDIGSVRAQFPILEEKVYGQDLIYLDNAASSQKPLTVTETLNRYYASQHANVHRGVHELSDRATEAYENSRKLAQMFVNASRPEEIIFVRGTTEGLNLVAESYGRYRFKPGDEILVSEMEHHSNYRSVAAHRRTHWQHGQNDPHER